MRAAQRASGDAPADDWLRARRDAETGIEVLHAHFRGHAYDPHDHDDLLVGFTEQGVQRFRCRRTVHTSLPGRAILIEPGAPPAVARVRELLHERMEQDLGLDELAGRASIASGSRDCSSAATAARRMPIWCACACAPRAVCWPQGRRRRRRPRRRASPTRATWAAGFAAPTA